MAQSLEERLNALEQDYVKLLVRDREKQEEIETLRGELERLRRGDRTTGHAGHGDAHGHGHGHAGEGEKTQHAASAPKPAAKDSHGHSEGKDGHEGHGGHNDHHGDHHGHSNGYDSVLLETDDLIVYSPSIGVDVSFYQDDGTASLESRLEELEGFGGGHAHGEEGGGEEEHGLEDGFNIRHAEVGLAVGLKGVGRAQVLFNASENNVEAEEAFVVSERLVDVFTLKAGKFRSGFGFFNASHSPEWNFVNQPLSHFAILGDHGLDGTGGQVVMTPGDGRVTLGLEAFNGEGETLFSRVDEIEGQDNPGVVVGWVKADVFNTPESRLRLGLAGGYGIHQQELEEHGHEEGEEEGGEEEERQGDGHAWFVSPGFEFTKQGDGPRLEGDWVVRGEYLYRLKDLDIVGESESYEAEQDGFYLEALYGVTPSIQVGARFDQIGLVNSVKDEGEETSFDSSQQISLVGSYWPRDWARISVQLGYGDYAFEDRGDEVLFGSLRFTMMLGPHLH
ncbi:MAG: hypothetical protein ISP41_19535 [Alphaproteobacteria bacterium]|nr:hypothetical protein [Alphaproteobacteria bacterium]